MSKHYSIEKQRSIAGVLLIIPSLLALVIFIFKPLIDSFAMSLKHIDFLSGQPESFIGLDNFKWLITSDWFPKVFANTVIIAVSVTLLQIILAILVALLLDFDFPGQRIVKSLIIAPWAIPVFVSAMLWQWLMTDALSPLSDVLIKFGLMKQGMSILSQPQYALIAIIVALIWGGFPFVFLVVYSGLQQVPKVLIEAAKIDGANSFQIASKITIPSIKNVIATVAILRFVFVFNQFPFIHIMTNGGPLHATETLALAAMGQGIDSYRYGRASAITTILFIILVVLFNIYYRISGKKDLE